MTEHFIWVEKYRPRKIDDCILPESQKEYFKQMVAKGEIQNMLLCGTAGTGKTTVARALCDEIGCDYLMINGSDESGIDTFRVKIKNYASAMSMTGGKKVIIIDEADYLNPNSTQPAMRAAMEEFAHNCTFIMTCNFKNRIIEPLHSRCSVVEFSIDKADKPAMASQFFKRVCGILDGEGITYDQKAVAEVVQLYFPDWRRVLNELQRYSSTGNIDAGILSNKSGESVSSLIDLMKNRDFTATRKWVAENVDVDSAVLYRQLYDTLPSRINTTQSIADAIIILADYQYKEAFVANSEINRVAALATLMAEIDWK